MEAEFLANTMILW